MLLRDICTVRSVQRILNLQSKNCNAWGNQSSIEVTEESIKIVCSFGFIQSHNRLGRSRIRDSSRDLETSLREVMSRSERGEKEREELYIKLESLQVSNDAQIAAGSKLEEEKAAAEEKLVNCQLQLQKLERQVEGRDQSLGEREEELERLRREVREEEKRSRAALRELEESRRGREEAEDGERGARGRERKLRGEVSRLEAQLGQVEEEAERMEIARRQLEEEVVRLQVNIREKDKDLQVTFL